MLGTAVTLGTMGNEVRTERLLLRDWRESDLAPFAAMNADPAVMEHFTGLMTADQSEAFVHRVQQSIEERGWGLWAVEVPGEHEFIGFVGLAEPRFETHFTPCVEVGWRLAAPYWGHGYASEAARASLRYGFERAGLDEIVSFTLPANTRSIAVMRRIGMHNDPADDFAHPLVEPDSPISRHVLYRLTAEEWRALG